MLKIHLNSELKSINWLIINRLIANIHSPSVRRIKMFYTNFAPIIFQYVHNVYTY